MEEMLYRTVIIFITLLNKQMFIQKCCSHKSTLLLLQQTSTNET